MNEVDTDYVAFIDNDILVSDGWMERLIACADETGAGVVGPVYLWGDGDAPPKVHMAGGFLRETEVEGGRVVEEMHQHIDSDPAAVRGALTRSRCDFVEFHCMVMRTAFARMPGVLDPGIVAVHEHIDVGLAARREGLAVYLEPAAEVTYLGYAPQVLEDLALMRSRWDRPAVESSIAAFCRKWDVLPDNRSFGGVRDYVLDLRWRHDPLRRSASGVDRADPMARTDLCQTPSALLDLAVARGLGAEELEVLVRACNLASVLMDGGFRPCGRPFVNHLIGTAGVLLRYDLGVESVCEGLLHAAYTHRRLPAAAVQEALLRVHPQVELRVRDYTQRSLARSAPPPTPGEYSPRDGEHAAVIAANEIDMRLSGEYDHSGRRDEVDAGEASRIVAALELLGVPGMARTLRECMAVRRAVPVQLVTGVGASYRIGAGNTRVPMVAAR